MQVRASVRAHVCVSTCMHAYAYICVVVCVQHVCLCVYAMLCVCVCACVCVYVCAGVKESWNEPREKVKVLKAQLKQLFFP